MSSFYEIGTIMKYLKSPDDSNPWGAAIVRYEAPESGNGYNDGIFTGNFNLRLGVGDWFYGEGMWKEKNVNGTNRIQFECKKIRPTLPITKWGIKDLLYNTFYENDHGINRQIIDKYISKYGVELLKEIDKNIDLLLNMSTNKDIYRQKILKSWGKRNLNRKAILLMEKAKISENIIDDILDYAKDSAYELLLKNPYSFCFLDKVAFDDMDRIGKLIRIQDGDPRRVSAAVENFILNLCNDGHTYVEALEIKDELFRKNITTEDIVKIGSVKNNIAFNQIDGKFILQTQDIKMFEESVAKSVAKLMFNNIEESKKKQIQIVANKVLEAEDFKKFDEIQKKAVITSVIERISILTGGPGTGKSTVTEAITEIAKKTNDNGPIFLVAPTGKAARRLAETTKSETQTIHSLLGMENRNGKTFFRKNEDNKLPDGSFIIIDEASMLDIETTAALFKALPDNGRVLFVGDKDQLPSVGSGYVLGDLISTLSASGKSVPCSELKNIYRTARNSKIAEWSAMIKEGDIPPIANAYKNGVMIFEEEQKNITDRIIALVTRQLPNNSNFRYDPIKDIIVLCPQAPGIAGTWQINERLSRELNPNGSAIEGVTKTFYDDKNMPIPRIGDRVMLTENNPEKGVMNGDIGTIISSGEEIIGEKKQKTIKVKFDAGEVVDFPVQMWRKLILAYAITGHKSQGSQYTCVIMPVTMNHQNMLERTLLYTEWTRAKNSLFLVGEKEAFEYAIKNVKATKRKTMLSFYLKNEIGKIEFSQNNKNENSFRNSFKNSFKV